MSRSIELGRAVLSSPATDHELWLTTFITVSPKQDATYLQQLTPAQYLDVLMFGALWLHRGHDMHIEMRLSLRNEPLPRKQLQDLTNAVLQAPVWDQLALKPAHRTDVALDPGTIHLDINHSSVTGLREEKKRHRILSDVPAVDIQPPEGIASVSLQSVRVSLEILETTPRRRPTTKRSTSSPGEREVVNLEEENSDTLLHELAPDELLPVGHLNRMSPTPRVAACGKRKRLATESLVSTRSGSFDQAETSKRRRGQPENGSIVHHTSRVEAMSSDQIDFASMVDGALRLSICGTLNKGATGWKAKASTFRLGLADVAPAVWKTGYLVAMSQRAHLLPSIARSISQIGCVKATSISLRDKMKSVKAIAPRAALSSLHSTQPVADYDAAEFESAIASHLWVKSQRSLLDKPMAPIKACIAPFPESGHFDSDDMLAEEEQDWHHLSGTTSFPADVLHECFEDGSASIAHAQATPQQGQPFDIPSLHMDVREDEDDLLLDSRPPTAMSMTACPAAGQLWKPGSKAEYPLLMPVISPQQPVVSESHHGLSKSQTAHTSSNQPTMADHEHAHQLLFENDVDCTEDLLLVS